MADEAPWQQYLGHITIASMRRGLITHFSPHTFGLTDDPLDRCYFIAVNILRMLLGQTWHKEHVEPQQADKQSFLRTAPQTDDEKALHKAKLIDLAELLVNFQSTPGIETRIERLRGSEDPEAIIAELQGAKLLKVGGMALRFVKETGKLKDDFDLEVELPGGQAVACAEVKCKIESTIPSANGLTNVLKRASDQLPKDRIGLVVVSLPDAWLGEHAIFETQEMVKEAIMRYLGSRSSIDRVIVFHDAYIIASDGVGQVLSAQEFLNPRSRHALSEIELLQEAQAIGVVPHWLQLLEAVV